MKPIISKIPVFDAIQGTTVTYVCYGVVSEIKYTIYDNDTGDTVYTAIVENITQSTGQISDTFTIPKNALINQALPFYVKLQAIVDDEEDYGELSDPVLFYCHLTPTIEFYGLEETEATTIGSSSYEFGLIYSYVEEQNETLASYQYFLYDADKNLIDESKTYYGSDINTFTVHGFDNNEEYYIRATATTINGYEIETGYKALNINYLTASSSALLSAVNNYKAGTITISSNISVLDGSLTTGEETYTLTDDGYALDLSDGTSTVTYEVPTTSDWYVYTDYSLYMKILPTINETVLTITETDDKGTTFETKVYFVLRTFTDYDDTNEKIIGILENDYYTIRSNFLDYVEGQYLSVIITRTDGYYEMTIMYEATESSASLENE